MDYFFAKVKEKAKYNFNLKVAGFTATYNFYKTTGTSGATQCTHIMFPFQPPKFQFSQSDTGTVCTNNQKKEAFN